MNIKRIFLAGITLVLMATVVACATAEPSLPPAQSTRLLGTKWALISLNGGD